MGLENHHQTALRPGAADGGNRSRHFVRMVSVVVNEFVVPADAAVNVAQCHFPVAREAAAHAAEFQQSSDDRLVTHADNRGNGNSGKRIAHIMQTRQIQHNRQRRVIRTQHGKGHLRADRPYINGANLRVIDQTVAHNAFGHARCNRAHVFIIDAKHGHAVKRQPFKKIDKSALERFKVMTIRIHMVFVNIRDGGNHRREIEKGRIRLVSLGDQKLTGSQAGIGTGNVKFAADHKSGIKASGRQQRGGERSGCGFPVCTGDRDTAAQTHQLCKHHGTGHDRHADFAGSHHFRVIRLHGRRDHHDISAADVLLIVSDINAGTERLKPFRHRGALKVGTAHHITEVEKHLGDTAHPGAADTNEVQMFYKKHTFPFVLPRAGFTARSLPVFSFLCVLLRALAAADAFDQQRHICRGIGFTQCTSILPDCKQSFTCQAG